LRSDELRNLCASPHTITLTRRASWVRYVARIGEVKKHMIFWFKNLKERDNLLRRPRRRREYNIKMDLKETDCNRVDSSGVGYGQTAGSCAYGNETSGSVKAG
jgi:hypothetical protein